MHAESLISVFGFFVFMFTVESHGDVFFASSLLAMLPFSKKKLQFDAIKMRRVSKTGIFEWSCGRCAISDVNLTGE